MMEAQRQAYELRRRLMNPPNAVKDRPIDLTAKRATQGVTGYELELIRQEEKKRQKKALQLAVEHRLEELDAEARYFKAAVKQAEQPAEIIKITPQSASLPIAKVQKQVAAFYEIPSDLLRARTRSQAVVLPRQVAMYLARKLTMRSFPEIGRAFGGRDHSTVVHACDKIEHMLATCPDFAAKVKTISETLEAGHE